MNNSIEIYRSQDGSVQLNVKLENETVWLTQSQMAELFGRDRTVITRHINNCYKEGELDRHITCAKFAHMGKDQDQTYETTMYNLDVIISVGYRVKSVQGTRFRQWATSVLKQYLIKGYAINQQIKLDRYNELKDVVRLMSRAVGLQDKVTTDEYSGLFNVISDCVCARHARPVRLSVALYLEDNQGGAVPCHLRQCDGGYQRFEGEVRR